MTTMTNIYGKEETIETPIMHNNMPEVGALYKREWRRKKNARNKWFRNKIKEMEEVLDEHDCFTPPGSKCICWTYRQIKNAYEYQIQETYF